MAPPTVPVTSYGSRGLSERERKCSNDDGKQLPRLGIAGDGGIGHVHHQRWWWAFQQCAYPLGDIPPGARERALEQMEQANAMLPPTALPVQGNT